MREIKFEIMFEWSNKDFTKSIGKHYTTLDRIIDGRDNCDYSAIDIIAKRQYTGLKDINGKEIYEGDIINRELNCLFYNGTVNDVVVFDDGCFKAGDCSNIKMLVNYYEATVIGNVHENTELLEG